MTCGLRVLNEEYENDKHSCFKSLISSLNKLIDDKNEASECIHVEIQRKNEKLRYIS